MNLFIEFYIVICVLLLLFDIVFLLFKNVRKDIFYLPNFAFQSALRRQIKLRRETGAFSPKFEQEAYRQIANTKGLLTLQNEMEQDEEVKAWFRPIVMSRVDDYLKKPVYEQAYYTYLLSTFDYRADPVPPQFSQKFMGFLDSASLYTFSNAMMAIYQFGETHLLIQAVDKVNERDGFYHKKLFVDGLLASKADFSDLSPKLAARFSRYTPHTQDCLLDFFRMSGYDASPLCMELILAPDTDPEVRYSAMRYFGKYPTEQSRAYFLDVLRDGPDNWLPLMLAIQGLARYQDEEVRQAVYSRITSRHWFVRSNAVDVLHRMGLSRQDVADILALHDKYTNETLLYQYRDDPDMSRYILDAIQSEQAPGQVHAGAVGVG